MEKHLNVFVHPSVLYLSIHPSSQCFVYLLICTYIHVHKDGVDDLGSVDESLGIQVSLGYRLGVAP